MTVVALGVVWELWVASGGYERRRLHPQVPAQVLCIASHVNFIIANAIGPHRWLARLAFLTA